VHAVSGVLVAAAFFVAGAVLSTTVTLAVLGARVRRMCADLPLFRCRLGPPTARRRRRGARWRLRRTRAAWVDDVLVVRSGALRLWLAPVSLSAARDVRVRVLSADEVRGLGPHPVVLSFDRRDGPRFEVAAAAEDADRLAGPFLAATLSVAPGAVDERGG
jgi:hypothetical protein